MARSALLTYGVRLWSEQVLGLQAPACSCTKVYLIMQSVCQASACLSIVIGSRRLAGLHWLVAGLL